MVFYTGNQPNQFPSSPIGNQAMAQQPLPSIPVGQGQMYSQYNGYFNPWEIQRRQDEQLKAYNQNIEMQLDFWKRQYISACRTMGMTVDEAQLDEYLNQFRPKANNTYDLLREQRDASEQNSIAQAVANANGYGSSSAEARAKMWFDQEEKNQKIYEGKSLAEQYQALTVAAFDLRMEEGKRQDRNMRGSYNNGAYRKLIDNSSGGLFSTNVDDMEVTLPSNLSGEYQSRRAMFLSKVLGR